ncbi:MAG: hypothetical protein QMC51_06215 [Alteromonadaceae bacterium]
MPTIQIYQQAILSEPDAFPSADLGKIIALTLDDKKPTNKKILALGEGWRPSLCRHLPLALIGHDLIKLTN